MSALKLAIHGAAGRMGRRLIALGSADSSFQLVAAIESTNCPLLGQDAGIVAGVGNLSVPLSVELPAEVDVLIDFSVPGACASVVERCASRRLPLVVATTGLTVEQQGVISSAAHSIPIVWAPSMSLSVNLAMKMASIAGAALRNVQGGADVEIIERHHRFKEDSPSGTALRFGEIVASAMGITGHQHGREGQIGKRPHNEIGYHAVRVGDNPGEHTIVFGMLGETLEIRVAASNRDCYAAGALQAAKYVAGRPAAGLYSMFDVLGL